MIISENRVFLDEGSEFNPSVSSDLVWLIAFTCATLKRENEFIKSIKLARSFFNIGLKEAKFFVEESEQEIYNDT